MKMDLTSMRKAFSKVITVLIIGCLYLAGNFLVGQFYHELVDPLMKSSDQGDKEAGGIALQVMLTKLVLYQMSYFVLSFGLAFSFRSLGAVIVSAIIFFQYLVSPIVTHSMPVSALYGWSQFISYQMATVAGAMLGLHMRKWEERVVGSRN